MGKSFSVLDIGTMKKEPSLDSLDYFETYSLIAEKITQLPDLKSNLNEVLILLKKVTMCHHLAIRVVDGKGNIPFYSHFGLAKEFIDLEHWITLKDCLCGYVASGEVNKSYPFISNHGSFFTSHMTDFMKNIKKKYPEMEKKSLRGVCAQSGYESVVIIPMRVGGKIVAELYVADEKEDMVSEERMNFLEKVSVQIGVAVQNAQLYSDLNDSKKRLMELFNSAPIGIVEIDTKGYFVQINNNGAKLIGYSSPDMLLDHNIKISDLRIETEEWEKYIEKLDKQDIVVDQTLDFQIGNEKLFLKISMTTIKDSRKKITGYL